MSNAEKYGLQVSKEAFFDICKRNGIEPSERVSNSKCFILIGESGRMSPCIWFGTGIYWTTFLSIDSRLLKRIKTMSKISGVT